MLGGMQILKLDGLKLNSYENDEEYALTQIKEQ